MTANWPENVYFNSFSTISIAARLEPPTLKRYELTDEILSNLALEACSNEFQSSYKTRNVKIISFQDFKTFEEHPLNFGLMFYLKQPSPFSQSRAKGLDVVYRVSRTGLARLYAVDKEHFDLQKSLKGIEKVIDSPELPATIEQIGASGDSNVAMSFKKVVAGYCAAISKEMTPNLDDALPLEMKINASVRN